MADVVFVVVFAVLALCGRGPRGCERGKSGGVVLSIGFLVYLLALVRAEKF